MGAMTADSPPVPALARGGRVRLRTLITVRWIAIAGQVAALAIVRYGLGFPLPIEGAAVAVAASAGLNLVLAGRRRGSTLLSDRMAAVQLGYDMAQLAALLYLTGGLGNPFAVLILAPVTVSATVLSRRSTISLSILALAILALLAYVHQPLPWPDGAFHLESLFILGLSLALGTAVVFIAAYVSSVSEEARRMSDALSATQMALDRERRLSAVGALAAAAAHELGTPLGTIALVAHEIARDLPKESPISGDVALLQSEAKRCRDILAELATRPGSGGAEDRPFGPLPLAAIIETAAAPYRRGTVDFRIESSGDLPPLPPSPEVSHGFGTLLQNAFEFARGEVLVRLAATPQRVEVAIMDDGPGFDPVLLDQLGTPYISTGGMGRRSQGEHMGLGVFIAVTLLERTGARLSFRNRPTGGSEAVVSWDAALLKEGRLGYGQDGDQEDIE